MKQAEDTVTLELPGLDTAPKRGRGRPRKDDALTPAQRARRYRNKKRIAFLKSAIANRAEKSIDDVMKHVVALREAKARKQAIWAIIRDEEDRMEFPE